MAGFAMLTNLLKYSLVLSSVLAGSILGAVAQVAVDGVSIGNQMPANIAGRRPACSGSAVFPSFVRCTLTTSNEVITILHAQDVGVRTVRRYSKQAGHTRSAAQSEIVALGRRIGSAPVQIKWLPDGAAAPTAVIARWGDIDLHVVSPSARNDLGNGHSDKDDLFVDGFGDFQRSDQEDGDVYMIRGARGVVYSASFGRMGHRMIVEVDPVPLRARIYQRDMQAVLLKDQALKADDLSLWPEVAELTRRLALETNIGVADEELERVYAQRPKKLYSRVWSRLPGSIIEGLGRQEYRPGFDHYGPKTKHPEIRTQLQKLIREHPHDPFIEFAYYSESQLDRALALRPHSPVKAVLHYGIAHRIVRQLVRETVDVARRRYPKTPSGFANSDARIGFINSTPEAFDNKPAANFVPTWTDRARAARPHLEAALAASKSAIADDAAYMLGFLARHEGNYDAAMGYFLRAMAVGNSDYHGAAQSGAVRVLLTYSPAEQIKRVASSNEMGKQPALIYAAARSAFRAHRYAEVVAFGEQCLSRLGIAVGRIPATTDPERIDKELRRLAPQFDNNLNITELIYLLEASRELQQYIDALKSVARHNPDVFTKRAKTIILKYSMITDNVQQETLPRRATQLQHKDLRQALHLIQHTLDATSGKSDYGPLREWLHYRKVRVVAVSEPSLAADVVAVMRKEAPASLLLDDAMSELIYAQAIMLKDFSAAEATFRQLLSDRGGNAVDNAHSWMAIAYYCAKRRGDGQRIDREIIRKFPLTRHARYARARLAGNDQAMPNEGSDVCRPESRYNSADRDEPDIEVAN